MKTLPSIITVILLIPLFLIFPITLSGQELYSMPKEGSSSWISFENISGSKGMGGIENDGAKGHAFDKLPAGQSVKLVDISGMGTIKRMWMTFSDRSPEMLRSLRIDMFWDGSEKPAVSVPVGDFFGIGIGRRLPFESALFSDPEGRSFNCVIPMPFKKSARITLTNESGKDLVALFYDVDLLMEPHGEDMLYFHAYWSRANPTVLAEDFKILPEIEGKGRYLGSNIGVLTHNRYPESWFGEGEVKIYLDGDTKFPSLVGSGTEDYIGTAYGQGPFAHQFQGSPVASAETGEYAFYRYHIPDPIYFRQNISVHIQQIGGAMKDVVRSFLKNGDSLFPVSLHNDDGFIMLFDKDHARSLDDPGLPDGWVNFYRKDDVSATAYFYLDKPWNSLPPLPPAAVRSNGLK